jgi:hypothetical protein
VILNSSIGVTEVDLRAVRDSSGIQWIYLSHVLGVRWKQSSLNNASLAAFLRAFGGQLLGGIAAGQRDGPACVIQFPGGGSLYALDSLARRVELWNGILSARPVKVGRWASH